MRLNTIPEMQEMADQVRRDILRMVHAVQSGHPGGSMGCTEFFISLFFNHLRHDPAQWSMDGREQDLFFLSNGHISPVFYSVLARSGYFAVEELATFRRLNSRLQGHPATKEGLPGVRIASGSLGQGMSVAIGAALAKKLNGDKHIVYTLHGDGELQEGQIWEAVIYAAAKKVDNIICTIDWNGQQIDGPVGKVMPLGDMRAKFEAFGWIVLECNGHDYPGLLNTLDMARGATYRGKPIAIVMTTDMGRGVDFMQGTHDWHGKAPNDEQFARAMAQLPVTRYLDY